MSPSVLHSVFPALVSMLLVSCVTRGDLRVADPASRGFSPEKLQALQSRLNSEVDEGRLPGVCVLIAREGAIVYSARYGVRDIDTQASMELDTIFRIYSMTKPLTAVAALILYEQGRLDLDEPASRYLPVLAEMKVYDPNAPDGTERSPQDRPITIRDLLRHTSGLPYGYSAAHPVDALYKKAEILDRRGTSLEDMVAKLENLPLRYQPGERWHYGLSSDVLGRVIEVASGEPLDVFCREQIFAPLGMKDTGFSVSPEQAARFANIYSRGSDGKLVPWGGSLETTIYYDPVTFFSGGGGAVSTPVDYLRFSQMLLNEGTLDGVQILKKQTVRMMMSNQLPGDYRPGWGFGFGGQVCTDVALSKEPGSTGLYSWGGGGSTFFFIGPKEKLIGMVWSQFSGGTTLSSDFRESVYSAIERRAAD